MRKKQPEFRVYKSSTPNGNRRWYIIGRPAGKRIRAWFATKEQAEAEATERNVKMRKLGETVVTLDHDLLSAATEAATLLKPYGKGLRDAVAVAFPGRPDRHSFRALAGHDRNPLSVVRVVDGCAPSRTSVR